MGLHMSIGADTKLVSKSTWRHVVGKRNSNFLPEIADVETQKNHISLSITVAVDFYPFSTE